jgi:hypothetical protein
MSRLLIEYGADVDVQDDKGQTRFSNPGPPVKKEGFEAVGEGLSASLKEARKWRHVALISMYSLRINARPRMRRAARAF